MSELGGTLDNNYLHVALGDSAMGCLRAACQSDAMPGTVIGIQDNLSHGPLGDLPGGNFMSRATGASSILAWQSFGDRQN